MGGSSGGWKNDVWSSRDGKTWTLEKKHTTGTKSWSGRTYHTTVVFDGKIWVLGGYGGDIDKNDVWSSRDGKTWTLEKKHATGTKSWSGREGHTTVVFDDKIWVLGGNDGSSVSRKNDVWSSRDGKDWTEETATWSSRFYHATVVFQNKIWVLGGNDGSSVSRKNDVWTYGLP